MQKFQILELDVYVEYLFGDFQHGLENLSSLEHVYVFFRCSGGVLIGAHQEVLDVNPNKPTLTVKKNKVSPR